MTCSFKLKFGEQEWNIADVPTRSNGAALKKDPKITGKLGGEPHTLKLDRGMGRDGNRDTVEIDDGTTLVRLQVSYQGDTILAEGLTTFAEIERREREAQALRNAEAKRKRKEERLRREREAAELERIARANREEMLRKKQEAQRKEEEKRARKEARQQKERRKQERIRKEAEDARKAEEEARRKAEEEARRKAEEEARRKAEEARRPPVVPVLPPMVGPVHVISPGPPAPKPGPPGGSPGVGAGDNPRVKYFRSIGVSLFPLHPVVSDVMGSMYKGVLQGRGAPQSCLVEVPNVLPADWSQVLSRLQGIPTTHLKLGTMLEHFSKNSPSDYACILWAAMSDVVPLDTFLRDQPCRKANAWGPRAVQQATEIAKQVATAMEHAHKNGVYGLDVKPSRVWLVPAEPIDATLLPNMGATRLMTHELGLVDPSLDVESSLRWAPREIVESDPAAGGPAIDVYAFGVLLWQLLQASLPTPFAGIDNKQALRSAKSQGLLPDGYPASQSPMLRTLPFWLRELLLQCLDPDRYRRPCATAIVAWLSRCRFNPPQSSQDLLAEWQRCPTSSHATAAAAFAAADVRQAGLLAFQDWHKFLMDHGPVGFRSMRDAQGVFRYLVPEGSQGMDQAAFSSWWNAPLDYVKAAYAPQPTSQPPQPSQPSPQPSPQPVLTAASNSPHPSNRPPPMLPPRSKGRHPMKGPIKKSPMKHRRGAKKSPIKKRGAKKGKPPSVKPSAEPLGGGGGGGGQSPSPMHRPGPPPAVAVPVAAPGAARGSGRGGPPAPILRPMQPGVKVPVLPVRSKPLPSPGK